jgi:hypothetical protein
VLALRLVACTGADQARAAPAAHAERPTAIPSGATSGVSTIGRTAAPDSLSPYADFLSASFDLWTPGYGTLITADLHNWRPVIHRPLSRSTA